MCHKLRCGNSKITLIIFCETYTLINVEIQLNLPVLNFLVTSCSPIKSESHPAGTAVLDEHLVNFLKPLKSLKQIELQNSIIVTAYGTRFLFSFLFIFGSALVMASFYSAAYKKEFNILTAEEKTVVLKFCCLFIDQTELIITVHANCYFLLPGEIFVERRFNRRIFSIFNLCNPINDCGTHFNAISCTSYVAVHDSNLYINSGCWQNKIKNNNRNKVCQLFKKYTQNWIGWYFYFYSVPSASEFNFASYSRIKINFSLFTKLNCHLFIYYVPHVCLNYFIATLCVVFASLYNVLAVLWYTKTLYFYTCLSDFIDYPIRTRLSILLIFWANHLVKFFEHQLAFLAPLAGTLFGHRRILAHQPLNLLNLFSSPLPFTLLPHSRLHNKSKLQKHINKQKISILGKLSDHYHSLSISHSATTKLSLFLSTLVLLLRGSATHTCYSNFLLQTRSTYAASENTLFTVINEVLYFLICRCGLQVVVELKLIIKVFAKGNLIFQFFSATDARVSGLVFLIQYLGLSFCPALSFCILCMPCSVSLLQRPKFHNKANFRLRSNQNLLYILQMNILYSQHHACY